MDNYPPGAANDPNAPYNEPVIPEMDFEVDVEYVLQKKAVPVTTDKYNPEFDEEDGHTYANTEDTNWEDVYNESGHYTIPQLLHELEIFINQELVRYGNRSSKETKRLKTMLESCQGWEVYDKTFSEA